MGSLVNQATGANPTQWEKVSKGGLSGLSQGLQNYGQQQQDIQNRPQGGMIQPPQAMPVDPSYFQPQRMGKNNLNFYGGS